MIPRARMPRPWAMTPAFMMSPQSIAPNTPRESFFSDNFKERERGGEGKSKRDKRQKDRQEIKTFVVFLPIYFSPFFPPHNCRRAGVYALAENSLATESELDDPVYDSELLWPAT